MKKEEGTSYSKMLIIGTIIIFAVAFIVMFAVKGIHSLNPTIREVIEDEKNWDIENTETTCLYTMNVISSEKTDYGTDYRLNFIEYDMDKKPTGNVYEHLYNEKYYKEFLDRGEYFKAKVYTLTVRLKEDKANKMNFHKAYTETRTEVFYEPPFSKDYEQMFLSNTIMDIKNNEL